MKRKAEGGVATVYSVINFIDNDSLSCYNNRIKRGILAEMCTVKKMGFNIDVILSCLRGVTNKGSERSNDDVYERN